MTKFDANWVKSEEAKRKYMAENGLYSEAEEHASCGVGLVVYVRCSTPPAERTTEKCNIIFVFKK